MELLITNLGKSIRRAIYNGRPHLIAPMTLINPNKVLNGSKGRLFYPDEEVARNVSDWDNMPLVVGHPVKDGRNVSAKEHPVNIIGINRRTNHNGKLASEGWFDFEATRNYDKKNGTNILNRLLRGQPIELSTGLYTDNEQRPGKAPDGSPYDAIARNYRPDHIAILPNQKGACDIAAGCGVFNSKVDDLRDCIEDCDDGDPECADDCLDEVFNAGEGEQSGPEHKCECAEGKTCAKCAEKMADMDKQPVATNAGRYGNPQSTATGMYKPMGAGTGKGDCHEAAQRGAMQVTGRDRELGADALSQLTTTGHNPPNWVTDEGKWEKAKAAADKGDYDEGSDQYWAVVSHIYQQMGGSIEGKKTTNNSAPAWARDKYKWDQAKGRVKKTGSEDDYWAAVTQMYQGMGGDMGGKTRATVSPFTSNKDYPWDKCIEDQMKQYGDEETAKKVCGTIKAANNVSTTTNQGDSLMAVMTDSQRKEHVDFLVANCDAWTDEDRGTLNEFTDGKIKALCASCQAAKKNEAVANAAREGFKAGNRQYAYDTEKGQFVGNACATDDKKKPSDNAMKGMDDEEDMGPGGDMGADEDEENADGSKKTNNKKGSTTNAKPKTAQEWLNEAPVEIQEVFNHAQKVTVRDKRDLVQQILVNVTNQEERQRRGKMLMGQRISDLQELVGLIAQPVANIRPQAQAPTILAGADAFEDVTGNRGADDDDDLLPLPTMNEAEFASPNLLKRVRA